MTMTNGVSDAFWAYARERYRIFSRRQRNWTPPWTKDPILQSVYFTNIRREDDKVTIWFKENIRDLWRDNDAQSLFNCVLFRLFTLPSTAEVLMGKGCDGRVDLFRNWDADEAKFRMGWCSPLTTGAYMIRGIDGMTKAQSISHIADKVWHDRHKLVTKIKKANSLQTATNLLQEYPAIGGFMAYEMVTDMRWTHLLMGARDIMTWANAGPGCKRGLIEVFGSDAEPVQKMRTLLAESQNHQALWLPGFPVLEMRDIEHTLCEFSKYAGAKRGERQKRKYPATK